MSHQELSKVQERHQLLEKRYQDLFNRTATLLKMSRRLKRSQKDLERSLTFMRAELNVKALYKFSEPKVKLVGSKEQSD